MSTSEHSFIPKAVCQVAAVCYRKRSPVTEFLLVNTNKGKWTFPKGCMEPHISIARRQHWRPFRKPAQPVMSRRSLFMFIFPQKAFFGANQEYVSSESKLFCWKCTGNKTLRKSFAIPPGFVLPK